MAITYTLGTPEIISPTAALAGGTAVATGDLLVISGITKYDTLQFLTVTTANPAVRIAADGITLQYAADGSSPAWTDIGTVDGGDGRAMTITFLETYANVTDVVVNVVMQAIQFTTNTTTGTIGDDRAISFSFKGAPIATAGSVTIDMLGTTGNDTIIYSTGLIGSGFSAGTGTDKLIVESGQGTLALNFGGGELATFETLDASAANEAITLTANANLATVTLGSANDSIQAATTAVIAGTFSGGAGRDTLTLTTDAMVLVGGDLDNFTGVEILTTANGANSITLGATDSFDTINGGGGDDTINASARTTNAAASGFYDLVVHAGAGNDTVIASAGNDNVDLGDGDDKLIIASTKLDGDDLISGGSGVETTGDILEVSDNTILDAAFAKVGGFEKLQTGANAATSFTVGDKAFAAGIRTIDTSTNTNAGVTTIDMSSMTADAAFTVTAGTGGTTLKMTAANLAAGNDTLTGAAATMADFDVLEMTTAGTVAVAATVTKFETLKLTAVTGNSSVTIDAANDFTKIDATAATGNVAVDTTAETTAMTINTGSGADTITLGTGISTVNAGAGDDTVTEKAGSTDNNIINTGAGDDIVNLEGGNDAVNVGASGALATSTDTVKVAYANFTSADTVTGTGVVTLEFTDATTDNGVANTVESKMAAAGNAIDVLKLSADASQTVTLGVNAKAAGISTIDATAITTNTNALTADLSAYATSAVTVKGGAGDDVVKMIGADFTSATSIQGGGNTAAGDTLDIINESTIADAAFAGSSGLEVLKFSATTAANTVTIGDNAKSAGITTVDASANTNTAKAQTIIVDMTNDANLTITTAVGNDTIKMKGSQLTSGDTIDGKTGIDTLEFTDIVNVTDAAFTNITGIEKIKLADGDAQYIKLEGLAKAAGILEVDASALSGTNSVTVDASGMSVLPLKVTTKGGDDTILLGSGVSTVDAGGGNDTVKLSSANLTSADTIDGGLGSDALIISDAANLIDGSFTKVSGFETVKLSDADAQSITLGLAAKTKGIATIDASALGAGHEVTLTMDASYDGSTAKLTGGLGDDILKVTNATVTSNLTFVGGGGTDTLVISDAADVVDADLAKMQDIDVIKLSDSTLAQTVTIGTNASAAGVVRVDGSGMTGNGNLTINASAMTNNMTITTSGGNDTVTAGQGIDNIGTGAGDDVVKIASEYFNSADTIAGGANTATGKDVLDITSTNASIADAALAHVTGIELVRLSSNSGEYNLTLGSNANTNGLTNIEVTGSAGAKIDASSLGAAVTIKGGSGVETVTLGAQEDTLDLGSGNDIVKMASASLTSADTIDGGVGTDTLEITTISINGGGTEAIDDADFTLVRNVEKIKLTVDDTQTVTLGDKAINAGITQIDAGAMKTAGKTLSVNMQAMTSNAAVTVTGGYGNDTVIMKAGHLTSADTLTGDLGTDTVQFVGAVTLTDADFTNVTGFEKIKLDASSNQSVTLGNEAANAGSGVTTVDASASGTVTVDVTGMGADYNLTITTGTAADTIKMKSAHLSANDTLNGGAGTDILEFSDQVNLGSAVFAGVSGIETIKLGDTTASNAQNLTLADSATLKTVDATLITGNVTVDASAYANHAITVTTMGGADTVKVGTGVNTVDTGAGNDRIVITSAALADANADTLAGGLGTDVLEVTGNTAITDAKLSSISGFETIELSGSDAKTVTLGANAKAGGVTTLDASATSGSNTIDASAFSGAIAIKGGSGIDDVTAGSAANVIQTNNGDDWITIAASTFDSNDTIQGGSGDDKIVLTGVATLADASFTNVTGVENLIVDDGTGQSVELGAKALAAGIRVVDTMAVTTGNALTLDISAMTSAAMSVYGGDGDETIKSASAELTSADMIAAGAGTDVLELTTASELVAADMSGLSGFETLKLANVNATQSLTLADSTFATVDGSGITYAQAVTVDATLVTHDIAITTKGGADVITAGTAKNTISSGAGDDTLNFSVATFNANDVIDAGLGNDTLALKGTATLTDALFTNKLGLEKIALENNAGQSVTLGTNAGLAGVKEVDASVLTSAVTVDVSGMGAGVKITAGSGADTITMGQGIDTIIAGSGNDTIKVANANLTGADSINGGTDTNILQITDTAAVTDDMLVGVSNIDTLKLSNFTGQSVTLGANATGKLVKVDTQLVASGKTVTIDMSALTADAVSVIGGAGDDTVKIASSDLTSADILSLGVAGNDTLELTDAVDSSFTLGDQSGLSGINTVKLGDYTSDFTLRDGIGSTLTVDARAATGVKTSTIDASNLAGTLTTSLSVLTSGGADTIILGAAANTVDTGGANDIIKISNANLTNGNADTIDGNAGTDELWMTTAGTLADAHLASVTNVEKLILKGDADQSITLGTKFADNGFSTLDATALASATSDLTLDATAVVKTGGTDIDITVLGGAGADVVTLNSTRLTSTDTFDGNGGTDTLVIKNGAGSTITDAQFTKVSEFEALTYAEDHSHALTMGDLAKTAGIRSVDASALTGTNKLTMDISAMSADVTMTVKAGAGADEVKMKGSHLTSGDLLQLGSGVNTLKLSGTDTLVDGDFHASNSGISKIVFTDDQAQNITAGSVMQGAGLGEIDVTALSTNGAQVNIDAITSTFTVKTGSGDDTITAGSGDNTINAGAGADTIKIKGANLTSADVIDGGAGDDILEITAGASLADAALTNVSNVKTLKIQGAFALEYANEAAGAGISVIDGANAGVKTIDMGSLSANNTITVTTGAANDVMTMKATHLTDADTIDTGAGTDELILKGAANLTDVAFTNVTGIEKLTLSDAGAHTLTLGDEATKSASGGYITTVNAAAAGANTVTINLSTMSADAAMNVTTSDGDDVITEQAAYLADDTVDTGAGTDELILKGTVSLLDSAFTNITKVEKLTLSDAGAHTLTLGDEATKNASGGYLTTVNAAAAGANTVSIDLSSMNTNAAMNVTTSDGNDVITEQAAYLANDTIDTGAGTDELILKGTVSLLDSAFTNIAKVEKLTLSDAGAHTLTLGDEATKNASGGYLTTVNAAAAGANTVSIDLSTMSADAAMNVTTAGGDDVITEKAAYLANDTIAMGAGTGDTLKLTATSGTIALADAAFTNVTGVETLKLNNMGGNISVTFGAETAQAGITTVDASANTNTAYGTTADFSADATDRSYTFIGSLGADTIKMKAEHLTSGDTITGGTSSSGIIDTLELTTAINSTDGTVFNGVTQIEKIKLAAGDAQKLTMNAYASALEIDATTNLGATDAVTIDASAMIGNLKATSKGGNDTLTLGSGSDTIDLGGGDDRVLAANGRLTLADKVAFGSGADVLQITDAATITDDIFQQVTGLETLELADAVNTVALGDVARLAGINTIDASASASALSLTLNAQSDIFNGVTVTGGSAADTITMKASHLSVDDVINGGAGDDTLYLTGSAILKDDVFVGVHSIKTLKLDNNNQDFVLGTNAVAAGIDTIDTSLVATAKINLDISAMTSGMTITTKAGDDTIVMSQGDDTIDTGAGNDVIRVAGNKLSAADTVNGGADTDVLEFTSAINSTDKGIFGGVSGIETIKLADAASQVLTLNAGVASTIDASTLIGTNSVMVDATDMATDLKITTGSGNDTIIAGSTNGATTKYTVDTGSGDDVIRFGSALEITSLDSIKGGLGNDTLELSDTLAQTITETFFGVQINGVETLKLADADGHSVTLDTLTKATTALGSGLKGIDTTNVGTGKAATINVAGFTTSFSVTGGAGNETVTAGTGADTYDLGAGDDVLTIKTAGWNKYDTIAMGDGNDTLNLSDAGTVTDDMFTNVTGVEKLVLGNAATAKTVTLGLYAKTSGLTTVDASVLVGTTLKATIDASAMSNNMTITTGGGADSITMGKGDDTVNAGVGNDLIYVSNAGFTSADTIDGGDGTDTIQFTDSVTVEDADFTNVTNVELIKLANFDRQTVTIGDMATSKGFKGVDASTLLNGNRATVDYSSVTADIDAIVKGGAGDDIVKMKAAHFTATDDLKLGAGIDTVVFTTAATGADAIEDADFALKTGLEVLKLSDFDGQSVTLGTLAKAAGVTTVDATTLIGGNAVTVDASAATMNMAISTSSGNDVIKAGAAVDTISTGAGDDTIIFKSSTLANDVIDAGLGTDTILISDLPNLLDAALGKTADVEVLKFSDIVGESKATLGTNAVRAGISLIDGSALTGTNKATIDVSAMASDLEIKTGAGDDTITLGSGISTVTTGAGNDTIKTAAANLTSADRLNGGSGDDTLLVTTAASGADALIDGDLTNVTAIETIKLSNFASQTVTLGSMARLSGVMTVDATLLTTNKVTIDTSAMGSDVTLKGGSLADTFVLGTSNDTVLGGAGDDLIQLTSARWSNFDVFNGGTGIDTIEVTDAATVIDDDFAGVSLVETVKLGDFAGQSLTLGTKASLAAIKTIDAAALTNSVTINASAATIALIMNSGSGNDTLYATKGANTINAGGGDDTVNIASVGFDLNDKLDGGAGVDILQITDAASFIDSAFANVNNFEGVKLSNFASQSVTLGVNAQNKGITKIDATALSGVNAVTIDTTAMTSDLNLNLQSGAGNDTFILKKAFIQSTDVLKAGAGTGDTLLFADSLSGANALDDGFFGGGSPKLNAGAGFETIALGNFAGQSVTLGANAQTQGISTVSLARITTTTSTTTVTSNMTTGLRVTGSAGADVVTVSGNHNDVISTGAGNDVMTIGGGTDFVTAGAGNDTVSVEAAALDAVDRINGGDGVDILSITTAGTITDTQFWGVSYIETLQLADGANTLTLGDKAFAAGIVTIDTGAANGGDDVIDASAYTANLTVTTGTGNDTIRAGLGRDVYNGGAGDDVYEFASVNLNASDKIIDSAGNDTLNITDAASITDAMFTGIRGIETLKLGVDAVGQTVTLGTYALAAGIKNVDFVGINAANVTLNASALTAGLSVTADTAGGKFITGAGADIFKLADAAFDATTSLTGNGGIDTVQITDAASIVDIDFSKTTGIEILKIDAGGTATLGAKAQVALINTVDMSGSSAGTTLDTTAVTNAMTVKLSTAAGKTDIVDTGAANDTVVVSIAGLSGSDDIDLRAGTDTMLFGDAGTIGDTQFAKVLNVENLKFAAGNNTAALGANAAATFGLLDATASVAGNTSSYDVAGYVNAGKSVVFKGGAGNETIQFTEATFTPLQSVNGGLGTDTLEITDTADVQESDFGTGTIAAVEVLKLKVGGNATLAAKAQTAGIVTVDVSSATAGQNSTINVSAMTNAVAINLGSGNDTVTGGAAVNVLSVAIANLDGSDTVNLGGGTDTLLFTNAGAITDAQFSGVSNVETLKLSDGANTVTLGANSTFTTVDATVSTGVTTLTLGAGMTGAVTANLGSGNDVVTMGLKAHVVNTNAGDDTITLGMNGTVVAETVRAGIGNDTIKTINANLNGQDVLDGSTGTDTLEITDTAAVLDGVLTSKTGIEILKLSNGGSATLGANAAAMGLTTVSLTNGGTVAAGAVTKGLIFEGGSGNDTITATGLVDTIILGAGADTAKAGAGNDTIKIASADLTSADTIWGEAGTDTLEFTTAVVNADSVDADFTNVQTLEIVKFGNFAGQEFNYGDLTAAAGVTTLDGTAVASGMIYDLSGLSAAAATVLRGGAGDDTFKMINADVTSADTIAGGTGIDTIVLTDASTITDAGIGTLSGVEILKLADVSGNTVTLGDKAKLAGLTTVDGSALTGTNAATIDISGMTTDILTVMKGGTGDDTFKMNAVHLTNIDTIEGNGGNDTLEFTTAAVVIDGDFTKVTGLEILKLRDFAGQNITLGTLASLAGVVQVDGSALTGTNALTIDATARSAANLTLKGGAANDTFKLSGSDLNGSDTLTGGLGVNTLYLSGATTIDNAAFAGVTDINKIILAAGSDYNLTLAANAESNAKVSDVNAAALLATYNLTLDASAYSALALTVSGGADIDTIKTGGGNDTITAGAGNDIIESGAGNDTIDAGAGDDIVRFTSASFDDKDKVTGNTGTDTIAISDAATVVDADFTLVTTTENLTLENGGSGQSVTLDAKATLAGIVKIDASATSGVTITNDMTTNKAMTFLGGSGNDTISFKNATFDLADDVKGGAGTDILAISDAATVIDADFTRLLSMETLQLSSAGGIATVGALAKAAGLTKVDGGSATAAVTIDAKAFAGALTMIGGSANDKFYSAQGNDTLTGNGGNDVFVFSTTALNGNDTISDFADGSDNLALTVAGRTAGTAITADDYTLYVTGVTDNGTDTTVTLLSGDTIKISGVLATNITQADFIYG